MRAFALFGLVLFVSTSAFASKNCRISSTVYSDRTRCEQYSTRFQVETEADCKAYAQASRDTHFFNVLDSNHERVIKTKMTFKGETTVREKLTFEEDCDLCW
jgi:hypothetical protein